MTGIDAEELKRRLRVGEREKRQIFDALFRQESRALHGFARRLIERSRGVTSLTADDLVQEAFTRFFSAADRYDGRASPLSYLVKIARNALIDEVRRQRSGPIVDSSVLVADDPDQIDPENAPSFGQPPDPTAGAVAARDCIQKAYSQLVQQHEPGTIAAYELRTFHGYQYAELAEMLGAKQGALRERVSSATKTLRDLLVGLS